MENRPCQSETNKYLKILNKIMFTREYLDKAMKKLKKHRELNYMVVLNMLLNKNLLKRNT